MSHPIHPPAYVPTEQEHRIAWLTKCLEEIVWNNLLPMQMAKEGKFNFLSATSNKTPESIFEGHVSELFSSLFPATKSKEDGERDPWDLMLPFEDFKKSALEDLASEHCGDCTAVACSCSRCSIEGLYKIPFTATWDKYAGWKLLGEYREMQKSEVKAPSE